MTLGFIQDTAERHMVRRWAIAAALGVGGGVLAQPWPAVPADKPAAETVYVMRTAGQNDRLVKVVRAADPADPASMAEVQDTASGQTFVIPGKVLGKLPKAGSPRPDGPAPAEVPPPETSEVQAKPPVTVQTPKVPLMTPEPKAEAPAPRPMVQPEAGMPPAQVVKAESVPPPGPPRLEVATQETLTTVVSPAQSASAALPTQLPSTSMQPLDPWRATGEAKAVVPTPSPATAGPRLTPVPTWRSAPKPTPPGVQDPWRPTGG